MVYGHDGPERLITGHSGRILVMLTVIWLCLSLASRLLPPLLPAIIDDLAITAFLAGIALTIERFVRATVEYPSGRLADELTRTTVIIACISIVIAGIVFLAFSFSYVLFLIGVAVFGMGRGMYASPARALISDIFQEKRGMAFGIHMLGGEIAGILAAGIAIAIVAVATWRAAFLPIALMLAVLVGGFYLLGREPIRFHTVAFAVRSTGGRILGVTELRWILVVYPLFIVASSGVTAFLPTFLIEVHEVSFAVASSAFALLYVVGLGSRPASGFLSDRLARLYVAAGGLGIGAIGLFILVSAPTKFVALGGVVVYAIGQRGVPPALQAFLMDRFPDEKMGGDLGAMRTFYLMIGSFGPAYAGFIADTAGFIPAFASFIGFFLVGAGILGVLSR